MAKRLEFKDLKIKAASLNTEPGLFDSLNEPSQDSVDMPEFTGLKEVLNSQNSFSVFAEGEYIAIGAAGKAFIKVTQELSDDEKNI